MSAPNTTPVAPSQFQPWASFFGGNVTAPYANPTAFGANALGAPPSNGQYTGGWAYPDAWANFYEGTQGFTAPQNQNSPAGALAAANYAQNNTNPNDPNLLGWERTYGNPFTTLQRDQNWAQSLGTAPIGSSSNELTGGWQNPEAWAAFYGGFNGFTAPDNAGSPASALAAASQIAQTSSPESNPALLGWVQDYGQPGSVLANTPNWAASLGDPNVNAMGQGVDQTNTQGWNSPLAWAAYYGGFQGYNAPVDNTLQAAQNWAGVTDQNNPSLLGWSLDYGDPQTVVSTIQASPEYQAYLAALAEQQRLASLPPPAPAPAPVPVTRTRSGRKRAARLAAAAAQAAADAAYYAPKPVQVNGAGAPGGFLSASGYGSAIAGSGASYGSNIAGSTNYGTSIAGSGPGYGSAIAGSAGYAQSGVTQAPIRLSTGQVLSPGTPNPSVAPLQAAANLVSGVGQPANEFDKYGRYMGYFTGGSLSGPAQASLPPIETERSPGTGSPTNTALGASYGPGTTGANAGQLAGAAFGPTGNFENIIQAFGSAATPLSIQQLAAAILGGLNSTLAGLNATAEGGGFLGEYVPPTIIDPNTGGPIANPFGPSQPFGPTSVFSGRPTTPIGREIFNQTVQNYQLLSQFNAVGENRPQNFSQDQMQAWQILKAASQGLAPELGAPNTFNSGFIELPQELQQQLQPDFNRNVDDFGRPIPDVGPPQPFSLPDFGGIEQAFGNLGIGWTPPSQPEAPGFSFTPDFGGMEQTIQQVLSGLLPGWTPPSQPEEQPGTFWSQLLSGFGNLGTSFNPNTPDTSGINEGVSVDQVANLPEITIPGGAFGEFAGPPGLTPQQPDLGAVPSGPVGGWFVPQAPFESTYTPPPDVFTDPSVQGGPFAGAPGQVELGDLGPELSGDTKLQKASDLWAKAKGLTLGQLGKAFGLPANPQDAQTPQNVKDYRIDLNNLPKAAADIWAMLPAGASMAGYSEELILQMLQNTYSKILAQYGTDAASVKMAAGAQTWDISGLPQAQQPYNIVYNAPADPSGYNPSNLRPPADVGPQGPPRPPGEIPGMPFQGGPFAGAPEQGRGELSYSEQPPQRTFQFATGEGTAKNAPDGNPPAAFIIHTTDTNAKTPQQVVEAWKSSTDPARQGIGSTYIMDPNGNIYRTEEDFGYSGNENFHNSRYPGITNATVVSMEVMAPNEGSITPQQQQNAVNFLNSLYSDTPVLAHSQVSPEDRTNEGEAIANATGRVPDLGSYIPTPRDRPTGASGSGSTFYPAPSPSGFQTGGLAVPSTNAATETTPEGLHIAPDQTAAGLGLNRIDPVMKGVIGTAMSVLEEYMPGYQAQVFSGRREQQGPHGTPTGAMDIQIVDPDGNTVPHRGQDTTGLYTLFAQIIEGVTQVEHPELTGRLNWGGAFAPWSGAPPGVFDLEHWDLQGQQSYRGNATSFLASLPPFIYGETQPEQARQYNPSAPYNMGAGYNLLGPFHGITQDPSTILQGGGRGGEIGPVIQQIPQFLQAAYNYFNSPGSTVDQVVGPGFSTEPTFAQQLTPQQQIEPTFANIPVPTGGEPSFASRAYSPPADVFAAEEPQSMRFQGGPLAGTPSPFSSSANVSSLTHGMYPVGTVPHTPEYQVFTGQPDPNVIYAPHNTTNFGDVGSYVDPSNPGAFNLTINPTGQSGYNTNLGGVSLPWAGTYDNIALVQAPSGEWQYLPIVDKGPNQTARSQGELDILNASLPGFGYEDRAHMPGAGWLYQVINPQGGMTGPPIINPQGGPYAGQQQYPTGPAAPVLRFVP